jgi:hypothetical protein
MGNTMPNRITMPQAKSCNYCKNQGEKVQRQLGFDSQNTICKPEDKEIFQQCGAVGETLQFCSDEHKQAFQRLTPRQQLYISHYMQTGSPSDVARRMELKGSPATVGKTLGAIARKMGLKSLNELGVIKANLTNATASELKQSLEKQEYRCALSGIPLTPEDAELDHKIAIRNGGTNLIDNLQWLNTEVNRAKGTMSQEAFILMCRRVAEWTR